MDRTLGGTLSIIDRSGSGAGPVAQPHLYVLVEGDRPTASSSRHNLADIDSVVIGRGDPRTAVRQDIDGARTLILRVPDRWMSSTHVRITNSFGRWILEDANSKNGTIVDGAPVNRTVLADGSLFELGHTFFLFRESIEVDEDEPADFDAARGGQVSSGMATLNASLCQDVATLVRVADSQVPVLLRGESGTGKEVMARAVHRLSGRPGDFVAVNCGAIPETLVESELFGHRKGAFSGATEDRIGLVRSANEGTLFLDEIADLPHPSQAALLRVLQESEVVPVGATRPIAVNIRLVAATHRDIKAMVDAGAFRNDLYARIAGFCATLPALRDRREDLGILIAALLPRVAGDRATSVRFEPAAVRAMYRYSWPLNIRELEHCLATAVVLADNDAVKADHLPEALRSPARPPGPGPQPSAPPSRAPAPPPRELTEEEQRHRDELIELMRRHHGNISAISRETGKARKQIQRWVKRYGIDAEAYRD